MENLTFNEMPEYLTKIMGKVENIEKLLLEKGDSTQVESDHWFDLQELCKYLPDKPTLPTVYGWVSKKVIPYHKGGKKLRFLKSEIDQWLKQGRSKTSQEINEEVDTYLSKSKNKA